MLNRGLITADSAGSSALRKTGQGLSHDRPSWQPDGFVAFLMTDIQGSTRLWESDPSAMTAALRRHDAIVSRAIESENGYVFSRAGDSFGAAFPQPGQAARAAVRAQCSLAAENWPDGSEIRVRMAIHVGEADTRDGNYFGVEVNRCARLLATCSGGQVAISDPARRQIREDLPNQWSLADIGLRALRDLREPEYVWQLGFEAETALTGAGIDMRA